MQKNYTNWFLIVFFKSFDDTVHDADVDNHDIQYRRPHEEQLWVNTYEKNKFFFQSICICKRQISDANIDWAKEEIKNNNNQPWYINQIKKKTSIKSDCPAQHRTENKPTHIQTHLMLVVIQEMYVQRLLSIQLTIYTRKNDNLKLLKLILELQIFFSSINLFSMLLTDAILVKL